MRIADDPGDSGEGGEFFGGTLGVTARDDDAGGGIEGVKLSNGVAGLSVGRSGDGASVDDDDVGGSSGSSGGAATVEQLTLEGGAISLGGAATELFDEKSRHSRERKILNTEFAKSAEITKKRKLHTLIRANLYKDSGFEGARKGRE